MSEKTLPAPVGPATTAILEDLSRQATSHRRWNVLVHGLTVLLALGVVSLAAGAFGVLGLSLPWFVTWSPLPLLIAWLYWKDDLLRMLGRPAAPRFPHERWALAVEHDRAGTRSFGAVPPGMRVYDPDQR